MALVRGNHALRGAAAASMRARSTVAGPRMAAATTCSRFGAARQLRPAVHARCLSTAGGGGGSGGADAETSWATPILSAVAGLGFLAFVVSARSNKGTEAPTAAPAAATEAVDAAPDATDAADVGEAAATAVEVAAAVEAAVSDVSEEAETSSPAKSRPTVHGTKPREAAPDASVAATIISLADFKADHGEEVWVHLSDTGGVYNVTPFLNAHAGGQDRIRMVAGLDLAKFWAVYSDIHQRPHIRELLEDYRIGSLTPEDSAKVSAETLFADMYEGEPARPRQGEYRIPSRKPWNSEPRLELLWENFFTPYVDLLVRGLAVVVPHTRLGDSNDLFFIRNHNAVPDIDPDEYELEIEGNPRLGLKGRTFTLEDLKTKFPRHEIVSTLQCAGNRQEDFVSDGRPLYVAPHWRNGAIGNARWAGVRVRDVLAACGMDVDAMALGKASTNGMKLVNFVAEDVDETGTPYAGVIPIEKVIDPWGDAILAYEMNGETLPRDHGFPIRLMAPGTAGCRNPKWVRHISVSAEASELDSGSRLDRHFAPDISFDEHKKHVDPECPKGECRVRIDQGPVIQTLPVQSVICSPTDRATLHGDSEYVHVKGLAYSGAGRGICRVEVSIDGGETFTAAELLPTPVTHDGPAPEAGMGRNWAWKRFEKRVPLGDELKAKLKAGKPVNIEVVSKAIDGDFNSQPMDVSHVWNVLGICVNHWCRVGVTLDPSFKTGDDLPPVPSCPPAGSCKWGECSTEEGECEADL